MRWILMLCGTFSLLGAWVAHSASPPDDLRTISITEDDAVCGDALIGVYEAASAACIGGPGGFACSGGGQPTVAPAGPVANAFAAPGAFVPVNQIDSISTPALNPAGGVGLFWLRVEDVGVNAFLLGAVTMTNRIEPDSGFPKWTAFTLESAEQTLVCDGQPPDALIIQNVERSVPARVVVNGASMDISGTAMIYTVGEQTVFVVLEGLIRVLAFGEAQTPVAGQETRVNYAGGDWASPTSAPLSVVPYTPGITNGIPVELFDRPTILPQPGYVATDGPINLRTGPSQQFSIIYQVPARQNMTILGRNPDGDWYHVRLANGQTGWMLAELLRRNHGSIDLVYESTPLPPQRYGEAGRMAYVSGQRVTLHSAPHALFPAIINAENGTPLELLARSPYSPWVQVQTNGVVGWVALLNVETQAILESLPVDNSVPPPPAPPEPTAIPGLTGFAFPDPACFPDC